MFGPGTGFASGYATTGRSTLVLNGGANGSLIEFQENGTSSGYVYFSGSSGTQINSLLSPLYFYATNSLAMTIDRAGGVTITAPTSGNSLNSTGLAASFACNLVAGGGGSTAGALRITGTAAGTAVIRFDTTTNTGAAAGTLIANKPGSNTNTVAWLPVSYNGSTGYIPIFG
jgi:hypothetical protein